MNDFKLYALRLWDYAAPSFCSGCVDYYGTREMILTFLEGKKQYQPLLEAAQDYFNGTGDGAVSLFGEAASPVLHRVEVIACRDYVEENLSFPFTNIWDCVRNISVRRLDAKLIYIREDGCIRRLVRATAEHMTNQSDGEEFCYWKYRFWGLPGFITKIGEDGLCNSLFYAEQEFSDEEEMRMDLEQPRSIDLEQFMLEIVGDG